MSNVHDSVSFSSPLINITEEHIMSHYSLENTEPIEDTEPDDVKLRDTSDKPKLQRLDAVVIDNPRSVASEAAFATVYQLLSEIIDEATAHPIPNVMGTDGCNGSYDIVNGVIDSILEAVTCESIIVDSNENTINKYFDKVDINSLNISDKLEQGYPLVKMDEVTDIRVENADKSLEVTSDMEAVESKRSGIENLPKIIKTQVEMSKEESAKLSDVEVYNVTTEFPDSNESAEVSVGILSRVKNVLTDILNKIEEKSLTKVTGDNINSSQRSNAMDMFESCRTADSSNSKKSYPIHHPESCIKKTDPVTENEKISEDIIVEHTEDVSTHNTRTKYSTAALNFFKMVDMSVAQQTLETSHNQENTIVKEINDIHEQTLELNNICDDDKMCTKSDNLEAFQAVSKFLENIIDKVGSTVQQKRENELCHTLPRAVAQSIQLEWSQVKTKSQSYRDHSGVQEETQESPSIGENDSDKMAIVVCNEPYDIVNDVMDSMLEAVSSDRRLVDSEEKTAKQRNGTSQEGGTNEEKCLGNLPFQKTGNTEVVVKVSGNDEIKMEDIENEMKERVTTEGMVVIERHPVEFENDMPGIITRVTDETETTITTTAENDQEGNTAIANDGIITKNMTHTEKGKGENISTVNEPENEIEKGKKDVCPAIEAENMVKIEEDKQDNQTTETEEKEIEEMMASAELYMESITAQYENNIQSEDVDTISSSNHLNNGNPEPESASGDSKTVSLKGVKRKLDFPRNCAVCPKLIQLPGCHNFEDINEDQTPSHIDSVSISQIIQAMLITLITEDIPYDTGPIEPCVEDLIVHSPDQEVEESYGNNEGDIESEIKKFVLCHGSENNQSTIYQIEQELNPNYSNSYSSFKANNNDEALTEAPYQINDEGISYSPLSGSLSGSSTCEADAEESQGKHTSNIDNVVPDLETNINDAGAPLDQESIPDDDGTLVTTVQFQTASQVLSERLSQESIEGDPYINDTNDNKQGEQHKGNEVVAEVNLKRKSIDDVAEDEIIPGKIRAIEDDHSTLTESADLGMEDQQVPGCVDIQSQDDTTLIQHTLLHDDITYNHEESFYGETNGGKVYACDADMVDDTGGSQCQTIEEHDSQGSIEEAADVEPMRSVVTAFNWRHEASNATDRVVPSSINTSESLNNITPLKTCVRPLRLGLSRNSRPRPLHKNFQIPHKR